MKYTFAKLCVTSSLNAIFQVRIFVQGYEETIDDAITQEDKEKKEAGTRKSDFANGVTLLFCFAGLQVPTRLVLRVFCSESPLHNFHLQVSYLTWGVLQEKIMTRTYRDEAQNEGQFKDSQFLVFVNRILAFAIALLYITFTR